MKQETAPKKKKKKPLLILGIILVLMLGAGAYYWIHSSRYASTNDAQLDGDIYKIQSSVDAYLNRVTFKDHQYVEQGDTLFVFDTVQLKAAVEKAKSALAQAKTKVSVSDIEALARQESAQASQQDIWSINEDRAQAKAELDKAKKDLKRDNQLREINAITASQYETDSTAVAQAKAAYQRTLHHHKSSEISFSGMQSQAKAADQQTSTAMTLVEQRKSELAAARDQLKHAYVLAPRDGIVSKRSVNSGEYITAGEALCTVIDEKQLWVTANFKETELKSIKPGQSVKINVDAYPDLELKGEVESFGGATGAKFALIPPDNATGNFIKVTQRFPLRIKINDFFDDTNKPNGRNKDTLLFPGLSVDVKVKIK